MTRKWLEGAAELRLETVTQSFTKSAGKRADELISGSLSINMLIVARNLKIASTFMQFFSFFVNNYKIFCVLKTMYKTVRQRANSEYIYI